MLGACRRHELCNLTVNDIEDKLDMLLVRLPITRTDKPRLFVVTDDFYHIYKKYAILRPKNVSTARFFLNYRDGKCSQQVIGINSFGSMPKTVAVFLKLQDPKSYTGHTFRRTSATLLADSSAELLTCQRRDRWKSNHFADDESEDYLCNKKRIGQQIAYSISRKSTFRETSHEIDLEGQRTTELPFSTQMHNEIERLNAVQPQTNVNDEITTRSPLNISIKSERDFENESLISGSHQTDQNDRSPTNIRIKEENNFDSDSLNQTDFSHPITTQSPINIYIDDKRNFQIDGLNALSSNSPKNIHFHFSNCPNISIYINKEKND